MHNTLQPLEKIRNGISNLQKNNFLSNFFNMFDISNPSGHSEPKINISETKDKVLVTAELPGVSADNIDIDISDDGYLTISGEKRRENAEVSKTGYFSEIFYGHISRTIPLPDKLDYAKADAEYDNGVLTLSIPKLEIENKKRKKIALKKKETASRKKTEPKTNKQ